MNLSLLEVTVTGNAGFGIRAGDLPGNVSVDRATITGNADRGIASFASVTVSVENGVVTSNSGGGIFCGGEGDIPGTLKVVSTSVLSNKTAPGGGGGGGIRAHDCQVTIQDSTLAFNTTTDAFDGGGGYSRPGKPGTPPRSARVADLGQEDAVLVVVDHRPVVRIELHLGLATNQLALTEVLEPGLWALLAVQQPVRAVRVLARGRPGDRDGQAQAPVRRGPPGAQRPGLLTRQRLGNCTSTCICGWSRPSYGSTDSG